MSSNTGDGTRWSEFDVSDQRYRTCRGTMHVTEAAKWVNFGQAAVAVVEMALFATLYLLIDLSADPQHDDIHQMKFIDSKYVTLGICLFAVNVFFACVLYAGIRYENVTMIVANLGWMTVSVALRGFAIVMFIVELVQYPHDAWWLGPTVVSVTASFAIQCLSCYVLTRCASFMKDQQKNRRRLEALAMARLLLVQYWRQPPSPATTVQHHHLQVARPSPPPPTYEIATINVPPVVLSCGANNNGPRGADAALTASGTQSGPMNASAGDVPCQRCTK